MSDLIKRSDAIEALHGEVQITGKENAMAVQHLIGRFTFNIANIPSVDVIEPKRGEWIRTRFVDCGSPIDECSICGHYINGDMEVRNFCPNCGAEMRGKERASDDNTTDHNYRL